MKSSKAQIHAKFHKIPAIRFEDQKLTSFSGLLIFQLLFMRMNLKQRLKKCFSHLKVSPIFGRHLVFARCPNVLQHGNSKLWILSGIALFNAPDASHGRKENSL